MDSDDELLDLVDKNDNKIGTILRSQTANLHKQNGGFLRAAEAFIQNKDGQLWIPRRQMHKRIAPGGLDYSMGEHVKSGEDYLEACLRGFIEELNLGLKESDLLFIRKFQPLKNLSYFRALYIYRSDSVPNFNKEDFSAYEWLTPEKLLESLNGGEPGKSSLLETASYLLKHPL